MDANYSEVANTLKAVKSGSITVFHTGYADSQNIYTITVNYMFEDNTTFTGTYNGAIPIPNPYYDVN